jgi:hypothetical protein
MSIKYVFVEKNVFEKEKHYVQIKKGLSVTNYPYDTEHDAKQAIYMIEKYSNMV